MKNLLHQTKQAFYFSLAFYGLGAVLALLSSPLFPIIISMALMISMLWVVLVLREVMLSVRVSTMERIFLSLFIIVGNIFAGIVYFFFLRKYILFTASKK